MIIRKFHLLLTAHLICTSLSQNARSYDTNDWVPITQKTSDDSSTAKQATGRVLNLDTPVQKFFPDEYLYKKSRPNFQSRPKHKDRYNAPKYENTYKFELPPSLPQNIPATPPKYQFQYPQDIQLPNYQQPPPLDIYRPIPSRMQYVPNAQAIRASLPNQPSTYHQYQQLPVVQAVPSSSSYNTSYYQTLNPLSINQELVGAIQYQNVEGGQEKQILESLPISESTEKGTDGKGNVQLVYVPLENLKGGNQQVQVQPVPQDTQNIYRQVESPRYENPLEKPQRLAAIEQDFIQQALQATRLQEQIQQGEPLIYQISSTTPKPIKKRKPHQPPLAVYLEGEKQQADIADVLLALQDVKTIAVQDSIQPGSPELFIGPSSLESPEYSKFPLPYLNSIDGNRINKKIDSLPFFVAPLSFKTPPGYSKISLPAPHVGSVVISNKEDLHGKRSTPRPNQLQTERSKQIGIDDAVPITQKVETLTPQSYFGQTYYNQGQYVSSPQPQLLQFAVNEQNMQYVLPSTNYNPSTAETEYSLPLQSQPEVTTQIKESEINSNIKSVPDSPFQYNFSDEKYKNTKNLYNQPKSTEQASYSTPSKSLSYTGPQTYEEEDRRPYHQEEYGNVKNKNENQYTEQVRYEPISSTFDANVRTEQDVVNIKPRTESAPKQTSNSYVTENRQKQRLPDVSPLELAINEFELHQINTQLEEKPRVKNQFSYKTPSSSQFSNDDSEYKFDPELHRFSSTPASILRDSYDTTTRPTTNPRNRIRIRPKTTTLPPPESEPYTVLEDFSVKQKPYTPEQPNLQYPTQQEEIITEKIPNQQKYNNPSNSDEITEIENIPTRVYNLNIVKPIQTEQPTTEHTYTLNQNLMDQQILQSGIRQSSPSYEQQGQFEVDPHQYTIQPNSESTRGHLVQYTQDTTSKEEERLNEYTSSLEDPSVRTLLVPKLLVPTTTNGEMYTGPSYLPTTPKIKSTTTTTTTERPIETTTQSRVRTRTRGGSRFNTQSTTKRSVTRKKPTSRVTTERSAIYTQDKYYSNKNTNVKSRFRTRGRTTPSTITERHLTTENEINEVTTPEPIVKIRTHPDGSQSYMEYEHSVDTQKVVPVETEENQDYSRVYSTSSRPIIRYDNTASTSRPNINVQVTYPEDEEIPKDKVKVRGRIRDKPRSSTTEKVVTRRITSKPTASEKEVHDEEFYGFFRQPDFGPPAETRVELPTTTPRHRIYSYQTPSQHGEDYQLNVDNTQVETSTVKFIGEIVPKYTTSREVISETETPKPRIRSRTRVPQKKNQLVQKEKQEQSTRRTNIIRSRGKTHYKLPENVKKSKEDDADVEGGNYPAQFLQGRRGVTTPSSNFQITVAPEEDEDDQASNPSLYRPNVVASPEEWHDASEYDPEEDRKTATNTLDIEQNSSKLDDDQQQQQPYALPVVSITEKLATTTPTSTSDESFNETTKQIEEQFEAINNFDTDKNTEIDTENPIKSKKKKGVWKLVKQRPVDRLETSESQNYLSVINSFHDIQKVDTTGKFDYHEKPVTENYQDINEESFKEVPKQSYDLDEQTDKVKAIYSETTILPKEEQLTTISIEDKVTTIPRNDVTKAEEKEEDFLDSIYEMFGMSRETAQNVNVTPTQEVATTSSATTTPNPTFPDELTEYPSSAVNNTDTFSEIETTTISSEDYFTTPQLEAKYEQKTYTFDVDPWDMKELKEVRTSTSTEVSHETEICYRGRCIRSQGRKRRV